MDFKEVRKMEKRKGLKMALAGAFSSLMLTGISFTGCAPGSGFPGTSGAEDDWDVGTIYAEAQELGYTGTLEEFLAELKGEQGEAGVGIESVRVEDGRLIVALTNGKEIDCGSVKGEQGEQGIGVTGVSIDGNGHLLVVLSDGKIVDCGKVTGNDGTGISNVSVNASGELIVYFTDGSAKNLGVVKGDDGKDGVGIADVVVTDEGV